MLGHMVYNYLNETNNFRIIDTSYPVKANQNSYLLNVTDKLAVEKYISTEKPDVVINCIGILIKGSQSDPSNAIYLNSYFPHNLSKLLRETGGRLIHISTDCVFSGKNGEYAETDFRDANDTYGRSKALGEVNNDFDLTLRTSIIGPELKENGEGLFHWFMQQKGEINGYTEAYWGGVTTLELAKAIEMAIEQNITGLAHLTNGNKISKYNLLTLLKEIWGKDYITIRPYNGKSVDKTLLKSTNFTYEVPTYKQMIIDLYEWTLENKHIYSKLYKR